MPLCFYIIYTPDTVQLLSFLVHSLLEWSDCTFCLVANGSHPAEAQQLHALTKKHPRLRFLPLSTTQTLPHGDALNRLQTVHQGDYFCFMDSDIYATAAFLPQLTLYLSTHAGVFSCAPVWANAASQLLPATHTFMGGRHQYTQGGLCLGSTYFAIYDNNALTALRATTGVGFEHYTWQAIPSRYQHYLRQANLHQERYDTSKVLNLLFHQQDYGLIYRPSQALCHLGGISRCLVRRGAPWRQRLKHMIRQLIGDRLFKTRISTFITTSTYFERLLVALHINQKLPAVPKMVDAALARELQSITNDLVALHKRYVEDPNGERQPSFHSEYAPVISKLPWESSTKVG